GIQGPEVSVGGFEAGFAHDHLKRFRASPIRTERHEDVEALGGVDADIYGKLPCIGGRPEFRARPVV
ncbi:MAG: hypothetical protein ACREL3_00100, partial [Gemmatimonadales bacterium]